MVVERARAKSVQLRSWLAGEVFQRVAGPTGRPTTRTDHRCRRSVVCRESSDPPRARRRRDVRRRVARVAASVAAPAGDGRRCPALGLSRRSVGTPATDQLLRGGDDLRPRARSRAGHRPRPGGAPARVRHHGRRSRLRCQATRICCAGCISPRWTASSPPTSATASPDGYVADTSVVATKLGISGPPRTEAQLREQLGRYRPELTGTAEAREAARFLLMPRPLPVAARLPYTALAAAAVGLLPVWARWPLRLPYLPAAEATVGRLAGRGVVAGINWAMAPGSSSTSAD
jgi:hypothetical protein